MNLRFIKAPQALDAAQVTKSRRRYHFSASLVCGIGGTEGDG